MAPDHSAGDGADSVPEFFSSYQLLHEIGRGAAARVFRARHVHPAYAENEYAIKIMHRSWSSDEAVRRLFLNEGYLLCNLDHANIVRTLEAGIEDERLFIAMEFVDGRNLGAVLEALGRDLIAAPLALSVFVEVLRGLAFAHRLRDKSSGDRLGFIHRDINPANVFISFDGRVKLGDFGIAVHAGTSVDPKSVAGTAGFFAPEQMRPGTLQQTADVFSCGALLYALCCGRGPFDADDPEEIMERNLAMRFERPRELNPQVPPAVEDVILRALHKNPRKRFVDAGEMLAALEPQVVHQPGMRLALAAMMRSVFLHEHAAEVQLRMGLSGHDPAQLGREVGLIAATVEVANADYQILAARGFNVHLVSLQALAARDVRLDAMVVDLRGAMLVPGEVLHALGQRPGLVPLVLVSPELNAGCVRVAHDLGAVDLIVGVFPPERLVAAVWAALAGSARARRHQPIAAGASDAQLVRLLAVAEDQRLLERLGAELRRWGYAVHPVRHLAEVGERLREMTPAAALFDVTDASPSAAALDVEALVGAVRDRDGIGMLPIVVLSDGDAQARFGGIPRSAVRPRAEPPLVLAATLNRLRADGMRGRAFVRYPAALRAELHAGGRRLTGTTTDVSRGGAMLRCAQMPKVGSRGTMLLSLDSETLVEAPGSVIRVTPPSGGETLAGVGFEFGCLGRTEDRAWIEFVRGLSSRSSA